MQTRSKLVRTVCGHEFEPPSCGKCYVSCNLLTTGGSVFKSWVRKSGQQDLPLFFSRCLAFAPDGKTLATAGLDDHTVSLWETASGNERHGFRGHSGWVSSVAYSADGRLLVSGGSDTSALVWAVWPPVSAEGTTVLSSSEKDRLWRDLADSDAARAWCAMVVLHTNPRSALALLGERLSAIPQPHEKKINQLIAELDDDQFEVRSKAERELEKLEELAEPALRRVLRQNPSSLEQRRRLATLLQRLEGPITSGQTLRQLRAVEVLEHIGSSQAQQVLRALTEGAPRARLTREAKAALERITHHAAVKP